MLFSGFPNPAITDSEVWYSGSAGTDLLNYVTWNKPPGKTMCSIYAVAGGGGGGGGFTGIAGAARGGGGGGGGSAQFYWIGPLWALPNTLYLQAGRGGTSGGAGAAGGAGTNTRVSIHPPTTNVATNYLIAVAGGGAGGGGTGAAAGGAGAAGGVPTIASAVFAGLGSVQLIAGLAGSAGGAQTGATGAAVAFPTTGLRIMGGTGGGGVTGADFAGGAITAITDSWLSERRPTAAAAGSNAGGSTSIQSPFFSYSGMGGGSSNAGVGGFGSNARYGSGGGGGGGGTTGGSGGVGGDGLIIINCW